MNRLFGNISKFFSNKFRKKPREGYCFDDLATWDTSLNNSNVIVTSSAVGSGSIPSSYIQTENVSLEPTLNVSGYNNLWKLALNRSDHTFEKFTFPLGGGQIIDIELSRDAKSIEISYDENIIGPEIFDGKIILKRKFDEEYNAS